MHQENIPYGQSSFAIKLFKFFFLCAVCDRLTKALSIFLINSVDLLSQNQEVTTAKSNLAPTHQGRASEQSRLAPTRAEHIHNFRVGRTYSPISLSTTEPGKSQLELLGHRRPVTATLCPPGRQRINPPGCKPEGQAGQGCSLLIYVTNFASQPISEV